MVEHRVSDTTTSMRDDDRVTKDIIKKCLAALSVVAGDTVFFHSSLKSVGRVEGGADAVIDAFLETLGDTGTLALPGLSAYDWENVTRDDVEKAWDIKGTPTFTGLIPETFRKRPGTLRSDNPTHSVVAVGRYASEITKDHRKAHGGEWVADRPIWVSDGAFGINSPWDKLYSQDAKYMLIGCDFHSCTLLHYVQVIFLEKHLRTDPDARWPHFDFRLMGRMLEDRGIVTFGKIGKAETRLVSSRALVDAAMEILAANEIELGVIT